MNSLPIGVFDSGVGGLTVLRALRKCLPHEDLIYLGDTARVPYGTKSPATVARYAIEDASFLVDKGVKMLVIACNTASALARDRLREEFEVPLLSVVGPGVRAAVRATRKGRVGVIATEATVDSGVYEQGIREVAGPEVEIFSRPCPLFVALAEEGETDSEVARLVTEGYLTPMRSYEIDTLVLGCTHYPLLSGVIAQTMGPDVQLVDSGAATAIEVEVLLAERNLFNDRGEGSTQLFVTDAARRFHRIAERILGEPPRHLEAVEVWGNDRLSSR
jgi:glutamate racemase